MTAHRENRTPRVLIAMGDHALRAVVADALRAAGYLIEEVAELEDVAVGNAVESQIRGLRAKLQNDARRPRFIFTVPGRGYRFVPASPDPSSSPLR